MALSSSYGPLQLWPSVVSYGPLYLVVMALCSYGSLQLWPSLLYLWLQHRHYTIVASGPRPFYKKMAAVSDASYGRQQQM